MPFCIQAFVYSFPTVTIDFVIFLTLAHSKTGNMMQNVNQNLPTGVSVIGHNYFVKMLGTCLLETQGLAKGQCQSLDK